MASTSNGAVVYVPSGAVRVAEAVRSLSLACEVPVAVWPSLAGPPWPPPSATASPPTPKPT
eukprot:5103584-Lingulodinium_polyedra.AAC.1